MLLVILWLILFFLSFGVLGLIFVSMKNAAKRPWRIKINESYKPKVSIVVPTYNESSIIHYKLENLRKLKYPSDLTQIVVVDSNSNDQTVKTAQSFAKIHPEMNIQILIEDKRRGKSAALNLALNHCEGDVIVVSDADCFWPSDILRKALPYLSDSRVGAVSGPKFLLGTTRSWVTRSENSYLNAMNLMKLGESKLGSTLFFEGGFSAYKKEALDSFDPYNTGSDDCGTIITLAEKRLRAILLPEAQFYTTFPETWKGKFRMKIRRANQVVRVLLRYLRLLVQGRIRFSRVVIIQGILNYLLGPLAFPALIFVTALLLLSSPYFSLFFLFMLIPRVRTYLFEAVQSYLILLLSILSVVVNRRFAVWSQPEDRSLLNRNVLQQYDLI